MVLNFIILQLVKEMSWETIKESFAYAIDQMTWVEGLAVFFALAYIFLAARESIWCWWAATVSVLLYIYICIKADLFAETALQFFYLFMAIYGWIQWNRKKGHAKRPIIIWPVKWHIINISFGTIATLSLGYFLQEYTTAAMPYLDSFTTVFALTTTYMVTKKVLENWIYWVVIDAASIFLYSYRGLFLTAALFLAYTIIAVFGYLHWLKEYKKSYVH
jgi:nicotinamide mononucleotide transporter